MNIVKHYFNKIDEKPPLKGKWLFLVSVLIMLPQMFIAYQLVSETIVTDLHSRIIGSRLLTLNKPVYFFQWTLSDPINLYDPNITLRHNLNGVTATPFFLWLQLPFSKFNYCDIKIIWLVIEELLLLITVFFTCLYPTTLLRQIVTILCATIFFVYSRNWFLHIYAGQYYILFAAIISFTAWSSRKKSLFALYLFPIATLLRPFFALAIIPFLLRNLKQTIPKIIIGGAIALFLLINSGTYKLLPEYSSAMKFYSKQIYGFDAPIGKQLRKAPATFETCVYKQSDFRNFNAGGLFSLQHYLKLAGFKVTSTTIYTILLLVFITLFILFTGYKRISANPESTIIASFLIYIFAEMFTPAVRNPYNLIQYLGVLGLIVNRGSFKTLILLIAGLALNHDFPVRLPYQRELGEALVLLSIYLVLFKNSTSKIPPRDGVSISN